MLANCDLGHSFFAPMDILLPTICNFSSSVGKKRVIIDRAAGGTKKVFSTRYRKKKLYHILAAKGVDQKIRLTERVYIEENTRGKFD